MQYSHEPAAIAIIQGGPFAPPLRGLVCFYEAPSGTWVTVNITGLPAFQPGSNANNPVGPHGFHIHEFGSCEVGDPANPFQTAGGHWNPDNQPHGNHAGDFPVLFSNHGMAMSTFFTDRFMPNDVIGKSVIIHQNPDDYRSQPAGNSGKRLACAIITPPPLKM